MEATEQDQAPTAALTAWRDLVTSEGWRLFVDIVRREWSPEAALRKIDQAFTTGDPEQVHETVARIQAARAEIDNILKRPEAEIKRLSATERPMTAMDLLRRIPR